MTRILQPFSERKTRVCMSRPISHIHNMAEIVCAGRLEDVARRTPEDAAADRSSEDATQVNAPDREEGVQATTPITTSKIVLSMAAVVCRNMTAWYGHETDKCWGEVKDILMRELVIGVPMTHVSENHCCVVVHRGINFPSSGSVATSIECVRTAHFNTKIMPRIKPMWFDGEMTGKHNSCRGRRWSLQESDWKSNSNHVDDMTRLWRLKLESNATPTPVMKATGRRRDIDETLMQHDVRASREAVGTGSPANRSEGRPETAACSTQWHFGTTQQTSVLRCEAIADQTNKRKVRVTRHCQTLAGNGIVVARAGGSAKE